MGQTNEGSRMKCTCKHGEYCCSAILQIDGWPYICTREKGHEGNHISCGHYHKLYEWTKEGKLVGGKQVTQPVTPYWQCPNCETVNTNAEGECDNCGQRVRFVD